MKTSLIGFIFLLGCISSTSAQTLFGTTSTGGELGGGTVYKIRPSVSKEMEIVKSFQAAESEPLYTSFIQATDGKLYGMTYRGGRHFAGTIISFNPSTETFELLHEFDHSHGGGPVGSLVQAKDGKLYGLARFGGNPLASYGAIFSYDITSRTYTTLHSFEVSQGTNPEGSLIQADDGKFYGVTRFGGSRGYGTIFSFDPISSIVQNLANFDNANGREPIGSLMLATNGLLYGTTSAGGRHTGGTIFSFDPAAAIFKKLHDFDVIAEGRNPTASLTQAPNGRIYGVTPLGGSNNTGVMFSFDPAVFQYTEVYDFDLATGINPYGNLAVTNDGRVYGMTAAGGNSKAGVIFAFDPATLVYSKLKDFGGIDGAFPKGGLIQASDGALYGMTSAGGRSHNNNRGGTLHPGFGVIFSIDPASARYAKLRDLGTNETGSEAMASLILASDKKLYGTTYAGGANGVGVLYSIDPSSSVFTRLKDFDNTNGGFPRGSLLQASDGKLYGMTAFGGRYRRGVLYSYDPGTATYAKLKDFDLLNGAFPYGSLIQAKDGKLYGFASGGNNGRGIIFSFDPSSSKYTKLVDFAMPIETYGALTEASDGKLYGTAPHSGTVTRGVIFYYDPSLGTFTVAKSLTTADGTSSSGNTLLSAKDGKLYGMTWGGGIGNTGFIFSFDTETSAYTKLHQFDQINGMRSHGNLMQARNGMLYGTSEWGGTNDAGAIFSFDPVTLTYAKLHDFITRNAGKLGNTLTEVADCGDKKIFYRDGDNDGFGDPANFVEACDKPENYIDNNTDCNDGNAAIHPGVLEVCNAIDDNCNGLVDEGLSQTYYKDVDKDGYGDAANPTKACTRPDGYVDNDRDCNDGNSSIHPGGEEICNGIDDNCDRIVDEELNKTFYRDSDNDGFGDHAKPNKACSEPNGYVGNTSDCNDANPAIYPGAREVCNGIDDDCDDQVDEGFADFDGDRIPDCIDPDDDNDGVPDLSDCEPFDKKKDKVLICHKGNTICINQNAVAAHLKHGDTEGSCQVNAINSTKNKIKVSSSHPAVSKAIVELPHQYSLSNYPNPFAFTTTIRYDLPFDSKVSIKVYDVYGRLVQTLIDADKKAGTYTVNFQQGVAGSSTLFYRLVTTSHEQHFEQTNKMILLK